MRGYLFLSLFILLTSCSVSKQIGKKAKEEVLEKDIFQRAHTGISIYEPATGKYWFNYQGDRYFVPASNIKIPSCYAAMKYLGDSLPGIQYANVFSDILLFPTGDPTLLHPDFRSQPVIQFLRASNSRLFITGSAWQDEPLGSGWSWNDYNSDYMAERSALPVYGNLVKWIKVSQPKDEPEFEGDTVDNYVYADPPGPWDMDFNPVATNTFSVRREIGKNVFFISEGKEKKASRSIPFFTDGVKTAVELLKDTVGKEINPSTADMQLKAKSRITVYSRPVDSLLRPMMYRSDNFFAEQSLMMVSNRMFGVMNDSRIIDTILKTDFADLPHKPRWVDGSGLSRYNLFTPQDFVVILHKMQKEFGMPRIQGIFPTGGQGTISNYYKADSGYIYGKTGTLSGVVAFSGFLYTKKGKLLIFSTLVNNHQASSTDIRKAMERFLQRIRQDY